MDIKETRNFIDFRLQQAGGNPNLQLFDDGAISVIHAYSQGSPRVIVSLCRNALLIASEIKRHQITAEIVLHTIEKTTVPDPDRRARAVQAAQAAATLVAPSLEAAVEPAREEIVRLQGAREERATQLLLRVAARARTQTVDTLGS